MGLIPGESESEKDIEKIKKQIEFDEQCLHQLEGMEKLERLLVEMDNLCR